ncbi:MAG: hypothetical protein KA534_00090 [Sediminibacterium sp.]|nr:hypothetical protein [Sediminibacterium sp.]MBP6144149.1 hypothetical protein [Sediminibacterium sp.]
MSYLNTLTVNEIESGAFPINEVLKNSLFYPACDNDGGVVKDCNKNNQDLGIDTFIYCDYAFGEELLNEQMNNFHGYRVVATRSLRQNDLIPKGWNVQMPPRLDLQQYHMFKEAYKTPFAKWIVYERVPDKGADFGPKRFSLIYIGGEGIATYQAVYWSNNACPKALVIIQPGHAFGLNWTDFTEENGYLNWVVASNPNHKLPQQIYFGGVMGREDYDDLNWSNYYKVRGIEQYYGGRNNNRGYVALYQHSNREAPSIS